MAKMRFTFTCGHTEQIIARSREQEYWKTRASNEVCRSCQHERANTEASEAAKAQQLPELKGTIRQIPWAETIRQDMLAEVSKHEAVLPENDPNRPAWDHLVRKLRAQTNAGWWIDNRMTPTLTIFRRWETERRERERTKPVAEILGEHPPVPAVSATRVGFSHPKPEEKDLRPAAVDTADQPVAGYKAEQSRHIEL